LFKEDFCKILPIQLLSFGYICTKRLNQAERTEPTSETERELAAEYNKLKNVAHQKARDIIIRCAFILEELGYPANSIAAKLTEDLPYHRATVYKVLPEKYKRDYQMSPRRQSDSATLESPLLVAIHSVVKTAETLRETCNNLLKKLVADKDRLAAIQKKLNNDIVEQLQKTDVETQKILGDIAELQDDRLIINELEKAQVKMLAQTHSLREIARHYHELKQELHGPVSTKIVSKIVKGG
jgi:hypothetical protein